jgi:ubiquitin C-terminal hydrolase
MQKMDIDNSNNHQISMNNANKEKNPSDNPINRFFKAIYNYCSNLIKKNPVSNSKDLNTKFIESFEYYKEHYKSKLNYHIKEPLSSKVGLINLLNDCYIISFLQILFHTPRFLTILKYLNSKAESDIIKNLILVSEYPFNVEYFYELKQLLGRINSEYSKPYSNDSQEFGIDLINYLISELKGTIEENSYEIPTCQQEDKLIEYKKEALNHFVSTYQTNQIDLEKLFLFNQIDLFYYNNSIRPQISSNSHMELTLQKTMNYTKIKDLINQKYNLDNSDIKSDQFFTKSKLVSLPDTLIISINRVLNNERINNCLIEFEEILDLKDCIDYDLYNDYKKKTTYHLYSINECFHSMRYSHYVCSIKISDKWYLFDDHRVVEERSFANSSNFVVGLFYIRDI